MFDCLESYLKTKFCLGSVDKNRLPGLVLQENMLVRPFLIFITKQGKAKKMCTEYRITCKASRILSQHKESYFLSEEESRKTLAFAC